MSFVTRFRALLLLFFGVTAWCSLQAQPAEFRVVNLLSDSGPLDIFVGDSILPRALNLDYGSASAAFAAPPGSSFFIANPSGMHGQPALSTTVNGISGSRTSLLMLGSSSNIDLTPLTFPLSGSVGPDSLYVRIFQSDGSFPALDYTIIDAGGGNRSMPGNSYKGVTGFFGVPRGQLELKIAQAGVAKPFAHVAANLAGGSYVTIYLVGDQDKFRVLGLVENNPLMQQPMTTFLKVTPPAPGNFQVRLVNLLDSSGAASLSLDDNTTPIASGVSFRSASNASSQSVESHMLAAVSTGLAMSSVTTTFGVDSLYDAFWVGTKGTHELMLVGQPKALPAVAEDSIRVRILNAAPDLLTPPFLYYIDAKTNFVPTSSVDYKTASGYRTLPAGRLIVRIGDGTTYQWMGTLQGGTTATLILNGSSIAKTLGINVLMDGDTNAQSPMMALSPLANGSVRILYTGMRATADSITVYIDRLGDENSLVVHSMEAGPLAEIPAVTFALDFAPNGGGVAQSALTQPLTPVPNTLTSIVVMKGMGAKLFTSIDLTATPADFPTPGNASVRFLNASADAGSIGLDLRLSNATTAQTPSLMYGGSSLFATYPAGSIQATVTGSSASLPTYEGTLPSSVVTLIATGAVADNSFAIRIYDESQEDAVDPMPALTAVAGVPSVTVGGYDRALSVVPNPVASVLSVACGSVRGGAAIVTDLLGRDVKRIEVGESAASGRIRIDVSDLAPGSYALRIVGADGTPDGAACFTVAR